MTARSPTGWGGEPAPRIGFRPLAPDDLARVDRWLAEPHVARWWPGGPGAGQREFGEVLAGGDPTRVFVIELDGRPAGLIQVYRLVEEPEYERVVGVDEAAGLDLLIGEPELVGRGLGPVVIDRFVAGVVWPGYSEVRRCMAGPSIANIRSQRAFEKVGFERLRVVSVPGDADAEVVMVLDRPAGA